MVWILDGSLQIADSMKFIFVSKVWTMDIKREEMYGGNVANELVNCTRAL